MTKKQKIILYSFLGMFIIPELLWSPVGNLFYELSQTGKSGGVKPFRLTFLDSNVNALSTILFVQFLGATLSVIYLIYLNKRIKRKPLLWFGVIILGLLAITTFYLFGFSINLRNIGF